MKKTFTFWKSLFLLCALIVGSSSAWASDIVVTLDNIGAGIGDAANTTAATTDITATGTTDSYTLNYFQCKKQGNSMLMTKNVSPYISNNTAMPGNIKSVEVFTNSGSSGKTTYDCAFSTTECTSAVSGIGAYKIGDGNRHTFSNVTNNVINVKGKFFCITLGNANNGQVLKLVITCESNDPIINATNPADLDYNATSGTIGYTVGNYTGGTVTASTEADWISDFNYDEANQIGFTTTSNAGTKRSATVTLTLKSASNETITTKNVTVTQNAIPPMVTIQTPTGGTLVVKNGTATVASGDRLPVGTELTIETTADATHKYRNWQYKKGTNNWATKTTNFTYTMDENDVEFRANFDPTYVVNWSVNGTVTSSATRYAQGEDITLADAPVDIDGRTFVGWSASTITGTTNEAPTFLTAPVMGNSDVTYYAVFASKETGEDISATFQASDKSNLTKDDNAYLYTDNETGITLSCTNADEISFDVNTGNYYEITVDGYFTSIVATVHNASSTNTPHPFSTTSAGTLSTSGSTQTITFGVSDGEVSTVRLTNNNSETSWIEEFVVNAVSYEFVDYCTTVVPDTRQIVNMTGFSATSTTIVRGSTTNTSVSNDQSGWTAAYTYISDNTSVATVNENGVITAVAKGTANITAKLNVSKTDTEYKAGSTKSMSIAITVVNPSHDVAFYDNGTHLDAFDESYEEGDDIIFPDAPTPTVSGYNFIGWATSAINGTATEAPTTVTAATMGTANVTYYAVYGKEGTKDVNVTFDPSDYSSHSSDAARSYTENGITLYINSGRVYGGEPSTFSVKAGTSYYFKVSLDGVLTRVITTIDKTANSGYVIGSVSDGATLGTYDEDNETQTVTFTSDKSEVYCYATSDKQIRASYIEVNAVANTLVDYRTSLPVVDVTVTATGYLSYCSPYKLDFSETNVKAYKASVNETTGEVTLTKVDVVPAEEGVVLFSSEVANGDKAATTVYTIPVTDKDASDVEGNEMVGVLTRTQVVWNPSTSVYNYILQQGEFRKATTPGGYLKPNRAYLSTSYNVSAQGAKALTIVFNDATTGINGVEEIAPVTKTRKVVKNGRLVIETPNGEFTIDGAKVK